MYPCSDVNTWMLLGYSCRDLVAVLIHYNEGETERYLVVCSAYLSYGSKDPRMIREYEELKRYCEEEDLYLVTGCFSSSHNSVGQHQLQ
jgi:hypothetical protein